MARRRTYKYSKKRKTMTPARVKRVVTNMAETKNCTYNWSSGNVTYAVGGVALATIATGTASNQRIGSKVRLIGHKFRVSLEAPVATSCTLLRMMVVKGIDAVGNTDLPTAASDSYITPIDTRLYKVWRDKIITLTSADVRQRKYMEFWIPNRDVVEYKDSNDPQNGSYSIAFNSNVVSDGPIVTCKVVTYYKDF